MCWLECNPQVLSRDSCKTHDAASKPATFRETLRPKPQNDRTSNAPSLRQHDHDFGRFDKRCRDRSLSKAHLTSGIGSDDGSDLLIADGQRDLCEQAIDLHVHDPADELIPSADTAEALAALGHRAVFAH